MAGWLELGRSMMAGWLEGRPLHPGGKLSAGLELLPQGSCGAGEGRLCRIGWLGGQQSWRRRRWQQLWGAEAGCGRGMPVHFCVKQKQN